MLVQVGYAGQLTKIKQFPLLLNVGVLALEKNTLHRSAFNDLHLTGILTINGMKFEFYHIYYSWRTYLRLNMSVLCPYTISV